MGLRLSQNPLFPSRHWKRVANKLFNIAKLLLFLAMAIKLEEVKAKLKKFPKDKKDDARAYLDSILELSDVKEDTELKSEIEELRTPDIIKGDVVAQFELSYDSFMETLEPVYYWLLDFLRESLGYQVDKTADFFSASEASGFYGEMGMRRTNLEKRATELLAIINAVVKSVINLVYDMREFELRFKHYDDLKSGDTDKSRTADLSLKTIWLTEVDMKKGAAAINALVQNLNFVLLRDAFVALTVPGGENLEKLKKEMEKKVDDMDITDVTKRILRPRIAEYIEWRAISEKELRKRFGVEKAYLKSQIAAIKLYTRWARPYLIGTQRLIPTELLELSGGRYAETARTMAAESATPFDVMHIYLELLGRKQVEKAGKQDVQIEHDENKVYSVIELRFAFRSAGGAIERGHYTPRGKSVVKFVSYVMSKKQLDELEKKKDDEVLKFIETMTKETLDAMADDLKKYLEGDKGEKKKKEEIPFVTPAVDFANYVKRFSEHLTKIAPLKGPKREAWKVALLRAATKKKAKDDNWKLYELYKKAHKMTTW